MKCAAEQKEAERLFERIGERIVDRLYPLFEREVRKEHVNVEAVAHQLALTLKGHVSAAFFLSRDLDPVRLSVALREARPLPDAMFSADEEALYHRALDEAVRYVVEIAARLPKFEEGFAAASLTRLGNLSRDLDEVLASTQRIEKGVVLLLEKEGAEDQKALRYEADYRQAVVRNLDYVELFGADIQPESQRQALSVAYVSLNMQRRRGSGPGYPQRAARPCRRGGSCCTPQRGAWASWLRFSG